MNNVHSNSGGGRLVGPSRTSKNRLTPMRGAWAGHARLPRRFILFTIATCSLAANLTGAYSADKEALARGHWVPSVRGVAIATSCVVESNSRYAIRQRELYARYNGLRVDPAPRTVIFRNADLGLQTITFGGCFPSNAVWPKRGQQNNAKTTISAMPNTEKSSLIRCCINLSKAACHVSGAGKCTQSSFLMFAKRY
jgi:hypothetical protein